MYQKLEPMVIILKIQNLPFVIVWNLRGGSEATPRLEIILVIHILLK
jgi:hypothetical protein